jgi:F-type H+-transporting ATPase subunit b
MAAPAAAGKIAFPPFDVSTFPSQLFWFALSFGALYLLMSRVIVPRLSGIIEERRSRIEGDLDAASRARASAQAAGEAYEKALAEARGRAQALAQQTRDELAATTAASTREIEGKLAADLAAAEATIATRKISAMANVRDIAVGAAADIVERLTGNVPPAADLSSAVDRALAPAGK